MSRCQLICPAVAQMAEMLEVFSTAADKSMGLDDFERMMVAAKLA